MKRFFYQKSLVLLVFLFFFGDIYEILHFKLTFRGGDLNQKYKDIYQKSINSKEEFWKNISDDVFWYKKPTKILNSQNPPFYKWFEDGITNTCYNALDFHIDNGRGDKLAIIYDSPITGEQKKNYL